MALTDGCWDLSDNYVVIYRDSVVGGTVATAAGADTAYYCIGSSGGTGSSTISFSSSSAFGPNFRYVVTDPSGNILGLPPANMVDFGPAGIGECWVWGLSYSGNVLVGTGDNATTATLTDGCYELSSNYVVVYRDSVNGGMITTPSGQDTVYQCRSGIGGGTGVVNVDSSGTFGPNFTYVVTDNQGTILGIPPGDVVDVTGAPLGDAGYGAFHTPVGSLPTASVGDNARYNRPEQMDALICRITYVVDPTVIDVDGGYGCSRN